MKECEVVVLLVRLEWIGWVMSCLKLPGALSGSVTRTSQEPIAYHVILEASVTITWTIDSVQKSYCYIIEKLTG